MEGFRLGKRYHIQRKVFRRSKISGSASFQTYSSLEVFSMHQAFSKGFVLEIQYINNRVQRAPKTQEMAFYYCGAPHF